MDKSPHKSIPENKPNNIKTPPIVGVPIFFIICSVGPSSLIGSKIFLAEKNLINGVPINKTSLKNVNVIGKHVKWAFNNVNKDKRGIILKNKSQIINLIKNTLNNNDYLMIKGSNSTGLNSLVNQIKTGKVNAL